MNLKMWTDGKDFNMPNLTIRKSPNLRIKKSSTLELVKRISYYDVENKTNFIETGLYRLINLRHRQKMKKSLLLWFQ